MLDDGLYKFSGPCSTEESIQVNMAHPPKNERVWLPAKLGSAEKGDMEETRDMVGPEV